MTSSAVRVIRGVPNDWSKLWKAITYTKTKNSYFPHGSFQGSRVIFSSGIVLLYWIFALVIIHILCEAQGTVLQIVINIRN